MILGFTGRMGSGKNEAAKRLAVLYPDRVVEISFARKLKESVSALLGITLDQIEALKNDPNGSIAVYSSNAPSVEWTFREFLQFYGTESHRGVFGQDFWLDAAMPLNGDYEDDKIYVVTDVRFQNEADRVRQLGGSVVKIIGTLEEPTSTHASEQSLDADFLLDNVARNDDFAALDTQLMALVEPGSFMGFSAPKHHPEFATPEELYEDEETYLVIAWVR